MELYSSDSFDECDICNKKTRNKCEFCGTPYCEECFANNEYQCTNCSSSSYE